MKEITRETAKEYGFDFNDLLVDFDTHSYQEHRRGSNFWIKSIICINAEWYPKVPREFDGYWETNQYVSDDEYGYDKSEITTLCRVEQKERIIKETYWEKI